MLFFGQILCHNIHKRKSHDYHNRTQRSFVSRRLQPHQMEFKQHWFLKTNWPRFFSLSSLTRTAISTSFKSSMDHLARLFHYWQKVNLEIKTRHWCHPENVNAFCSFHFWSTWYNRSVHHLSTEDSALYLKPRSQMGQYIRRLFTRVFNHFIWPIICSSQRCPASCFHRRIRICRICSRLLSHRIRWLYRTGEVCNG